MRVFLAIVIWLISACSFAQSTHLFKSVHADGTVVYSDTRPASAVSVQEMGIPRANAAIEQQGKQRMQELNATNKRVDEQQAEAAKARREYQDRLAQAQQWARDTERNLAAARQSKKNATAEYIGNWEERVRLARQHLREVQSAGP
jgi:chromosome segregation ATPase